MQLILNKDALLSEEKERVAEDTRIEESHKLFEAFRAGKSDKIVTLVGKVLAKHGKFIVDMGMKEAFSNQDGQFVGYTAYGKGRQYRINFLLSQSEYIHSLDIFNAKKQKVQSWHFSRDANVVTIVNEMARILFGVTITNQQRESIESNVERMGLEEKVSLTEGPIEKELGFNITQTYEFLKQWFSEQDPETGFVRMELLKNASIREIKAELEEYWPDGVIPSNATVKSNVAKVMAYYVKRGSLRTSNPLLMTKEVKQKLEGSSFDAEENPDVNDVPANQRDVVNTVTSVLEPKVDDSVAVEGDVYEDVNQIEILFDSVSSTNNVLNGIKRWTKEWKSMTRGWGHFLHMWPRGDFETSSIRGMIVAGVAGSGKSHYAEEKAREYPNKVGIVTKNTMGAQTQNGITQQLIIHHDKDIIVFDDSLDIAGKKPVEDFMKGFMQPYNTTSGSLVTPEISGDLSRLAKKERGTSEPFRSKAAIFVVTNRDPRKIAASVRSRMRTVALPFTREELIDKMGTEFEAPEGYSDEHVKDTTALFLSIFQHKVKGKKDDEAESIGEGLNFRNFAEAVKLRFRVDIDPEYMRRDWIEEVTEDLFGIGLRTLDGFAER